MNPMIDVLATAGGSIVLAVFFVWLLVSAARQERDGGADRGRSGSTSRPLGSRSSSAASKGDFAHG